jgi:RHS repeat-associated protein
MVAVAVTALGLHVLVSDEASAALVTAPPTTVASARAVSTVPVARLKVAPESPAGAVPAPLAPKSGPAPAAVRRAAVSSISLTAAVNPNRTITLTAVASGTVQDTNQVLAIYDTTSGARIAYCSSSCSNGTTLSATTVPFAATTALSSIAHQYVAMLDSGSPSYPPATASVTSNTVTTDPWSVTLTRTPITNGTFTLTATSNYNLGSSGYYLTIYDITTGARQGYCSTCTGPAGNTLSVTTVPMASTTALSEVAHEYVAVVDNTGITYPQRSNSADESPRVTADRWSVTLTRTANTNGTFTLTATSNYNLSNSGYYLTIHDITTGARQGYCSTCTGPAGNIMSVGVSGDQLLHTFVATVSNAGPNYPPGNIAARSGQVTPKPVGATLSELIGGCNLVQLLDCFASAGDPVDLDGGAWFDTSTDLEVPGRGVPLALSRTFDTRMASVAGRLGFGWTDSYDWALRVDTSTGPTAGWVTIRQANGSQVVFTPDGSGGFTVPGRILATLAKNGDGTWTYVARRNLRYTFSADGRLTEVRDRNNYATSLGYDASNRLVTVTDPAGRTLTFGYDASNRVTSVTDPLPRTVRYAYDTNGNLSTVTDVDGKVWTFTYDAAHRLLTAMDPRNNTLTNVYDTSGRVIRQTDRRGKVTLFDYGTVTNGSHTTTVTHPRGNKDTYTYTNRQVLTIVRGVGSAEAQTENRSYDPVTNGLTSRTVGGRTTAWTYDVHGNRLSETDALNRTTTWTYNEFNQPLTESDSAGVTTTRTYDAAGNLTSIARPLVGASPAQTATVRYTYGDAVHPGDVTRTTDARGKATDYVYDARGNCTSVTDPTGRRTTHTYNIVGWLTSTVSPAGNATGGTPAQWTTTFADFTGFGQPRTITDPLGNDTTYAFDATQNRTEVLDADNRRTRIDHDGLGNPVLVTKPDGSTQATSYDDNGNRAVQTDGLIQTTTTGYDALDRPTWIRDAANRVTTRTYSPAGDLHTVVQPGTGTATLTSTFSYDAAGRLSGIAYGDGTTPDVTFTYDAAGHRRTMTDGTGTTTYDTDSLGRRTRVTNGAGKVVSYAYDLGDNATEITYPSGSTVARTFDDAGRLETVQDWVSGTPTSFGYDADGRWATTTSPNGVVGAREYDRADSLTAISYARSSTALGSWAHTRTAAALLATSTPSAEAPGTAATYAYTTDGQLKSVTGPAATTVWAYDAADRLIRNPAGTVFDYDAVDQLTTAMPATGAATTYEYDARGNRTSAKEGTAAAGAYAYDGASRLTRWTTPAGAASTYTYDGDGLRASKTPAGGATQVMTWDDSTGENPLLLDDGISAYLYGPGDTPIGQITGTTASYLHQDQLGSTALVTSAAGAVVGKYAYDPYGTATFTGTVAARFQFAGEYADAESGLLYLRARYYDPATAQFLTRDPLFGLTRSAYGYAAGNPLTWTDPTGLFCWSLSTSCVLENVHDGGVAVGVAADLCLVAVVSAPVCGPAGTIADVATVGAGTIRVRRGEQSYTELLVDGVGMIPGVTAMSLELRSGRWIDDMLAARRPVTNDLLLRSARHLDWVMRFGALNLLISFCGAPGVIDSFG